MNPLALLILAGIPRGRDRTRFADKYGWLGKQQPGHLSHLSYLSQTPRKTQQTNRKATFLRWLI
jgi:hypothetical protein